MAAREKPWQEVIAIVLGHSGYNTKKPVYEPMPEGCKLMTIFPSDIGSQCFARHSVVIQTVKDMIDEGYFHSTPDYIIDGINASLKPFDADPIFKPEVREDYSTFLQSYGTTSIKDEYYNKIWTFRPFDPENPEGLGCILILMINGDEIVVSQPMEEELRAGGRVSKKALIEGLSIHYKNILLIDISCNETIGTPETIEAFKARGTYGGKTKRKRKRVRSKKR